jgi:amino acid adenylation domain-containing protein
VSAQSTQQPGELVSFRLSPQQELLWRLGGDDQGYRAQCSALLPGEWSQDRIELALARIVERHEILRTVFVRSPGIRLPSQSVLPILELSLSTVELEEGSTAEPLLAEEANFPFDFERGPVLRARLARTSPETWMLVLTTPSVIADAGSLLVILRELESLVSAAGGTELDEPLQYADYAEWRNTAVEAVESQPPTAEDDPIASPILLFGKRAPLSESFSVERVGVSLSAPTRANVIAGAAGLGVDVARLAEACWHSCVARLTGATDIVISDLSTGRGHAELEGAVGAYAQSLPVQTHIEEDTSLAEVLDELQRAVERQDQRQDSLDADALERLSAPCSIAFAAIDARSTGSVSVSTLSARAARSDLQLTWLETPAGPAAEIHYAPAAYSREDAERIAEHFATLLASAVAVPDAAVSQLELTTELERERLVHELNQTQAAAPALCIHELFEQQVSRTPERCAVLDGSDRLTYRELNAQANGVARRLRELGVGRGDAVALCMHRSIRMMVGLIGILKAGGAYVPLNYEHPHTRLVHQLGEAEVKVLVTDADLVDALPPFDGAVLTVDGDPAAEDETNPECSNDPDDLVYVMYTSGSTGLPKGVAVTHRNLTNYATAIAARLGVEDAAEDDGLQFAVVSAISTDLGNTAIFTPLVAGGSIHLIAPDVSLDADRFESYATANRIDVLKITPSHLSSLLATSEGPSVLPHRWLVAGGEALPWQLVEQAHARRPGLRILNHYGPTETTVGCCTFEIGGEVSAASPATVPIGRPIANTCAYIVDTRSSPVPVGVPAELWIGGAGVARGYVNRPDETAQRFVPDPFRPGGHVYRTGDLARYLPDGDIEFLGRIDQQVKIRGFRVEPGEVEAALARHPSVRQAAVVAREDGNRDPRLVAYFVASTEPSTEELHTFLAEVLPDFMIPSTYVGLDAMPLTPSGKIDRQALPDPTAVEAARKERYVAPRDEVEEELARIWSELLGVEPVGVFDDFFELGGHSLLATQVIMRARRAFGDVPLQAMFIAPTVAGLAEAIRATRAATSEA